MENGYSICFNKWALDKNIKNELRLLLIISSLTAENGYCFASNKYLADLFSETEVSISNKIKNLEKNNYIEIEYDKRGCEIISRRIRLKNILIHDYKNFYSTIKKDFKDNNISNNNTSNNNIFKKPTLEEVKEYCLERNNGIDAEKFIDFYESKGWMVGKTKMKDWKACVRTWEKRKNTKYVIQEKELPNWFNEEQDIHIITKQEEEEMESILKELQ